MVTTLISSLTLLSIILLIIGFVLIAIELMLPGFSLPGILGSICLIASVLLTARTFGEALIMIIGILTVLGIMLVVILSLFAKGKISNHLVLKDEQKKEQGYISTSDLEYLLGKEGTAITDLKPTGIGDFSGVNFEVVSEGQYVRKGTKIVIYKVTGSKLIIKTREISC